MSTRNLDKMMAPKSVVAIGASVRPGSVGAAVTRNLLAGAFHGNIHLVNVKGGEIDGRRVFRRLAEVPEVPDLAVVMTPAETIPRLIRELGQRGTRVAVVISAGPGNGVDGAEEIAGAIFTPDSLARAIARGRDPKAMLQDNDGHSFFELIGDSLVTGPTRTSVNDFRATLILPNT